MFGRKNQNILSMGLGTYYYFEAAFWGGSQFFKPYKFYQLLKQQKSEFQAFN